MEIKKPYTVVQYHKLMKGVDRTDKYPCYYSILRKTVKWLKKVVLYLLNCALFNAFFVYKTLNTHKKKVQELLHVVTRSWTSEVQNPTESTYDELLWPEKQPAPKGLNRTTQADSPRISAKTKRERIVAGGEGKKQYPARQCNMCAAHK
jgi:hypothetical protein